MSVSVAALLEEVAQRAGPWEGELPFTGNLQRLLRACSDTGRLNATGVEVLHRAAVRHLRNLAGVQAYVAADPHVADRPFGGAVVVTGLPRTGTTLLHNLLALDPSHRALRFWEALRPRAAGCVPERRTGCVAEGRTGCVPERRTGCVPERRTGAAGPPVEELVAQAQRWLDAFYRMVPEFRAIHAASPTGPEECDALLQNTFASQHFDDMFDAADYSAWYAEASLFAEYEHYSLQLRIVSAGEDPPTWALKSPSHLGHLDALRAALPGCTVVMCHRHPHQAVASYASLVHTLRRAYSESVSAEAVGAQALWRAATAMRRAMAVRDADGSGVVDVSYRHLVGDPVGAVREVYRRMGRPLAPAMEEAVRRWVLDNPAGRHGAHRYGLSDFGLTEDQVDEAFAPYTERFGAFVQP